MRDHRRNEPDINTFPIQDGCQLGKRHKKGPTYKAMRLKALVPGMRPNEPDINSVSLVRNSMTQLTLDCW